MTCHQIRTKTRRGAALVLLIAVLLLVVVSATRSLVTNEVANRRAERKSVQSRMMLLALEQASLLSSDWKGPLVFPVTESIDERIEVTASDDRSELTAAWHVREIETFKITRPAVSVVRKQTPGQPSTQEIDD